MYKRHGWLILIIAILFILSACNVAEEAGVEVKDELDTAKVKSASKEEATESLNVEEVQKIIEGKVLEMHSVMRQIIDDHDEEWFTKMQKWVLNEENEDEYFKVELDQVRAELSSVMTDQAFVQLAKDLLPFYFCDCGAYDTIREKDARIGVEIINQSANYFQATSLSIGDVAFREKGWTNKWGFKKDGADWKLDKHQYIQAEEEPLNLTFDDLDYAFKDYETDKIRKIEFVENIMFEDREHLIIQYEDGFYDAYDVKDGSVYFASRENYNAADDENVEDTPPPVNDKDAEINPEEVSDSEHYTEGLTPEDYSAMEPWGGDWDRIENHGKGQGYLTIRPPAMDVVILGESRSVISFSADISGDKASYYDEETGCKLDLTLNNESIEIKEIGKCNELDSSPEGIYEHVGRRDL